MLAGLCGNRPPDLVPQALELPIQAAGGGVQDQPTGVGELVESPAIQVELVGFAMVGTVVLQRHPVAGPGQVRVQDATRPDADRVLRHWRRDAAQYQLDT